MGWGRRMILCTKSEVLLKNFFSKCDRIRRKLQIWSYLLKKSLMGNFIFLYVVIPLRFQMTT